MIDVEFSWSYILGVVDDEESWVWGFIFFLFWKYVYEFLDDGFVDCNCKVVVLVECDCVYRVLRG